jgi:hypothetical protein
MNRMVIYFGLVLVIIGLLVMALGGLGVRLGRLPGDLVIRRPGFTFCFPLVTSILISLLLTLILWIVMAVARR